MKANLDTLLEASRDRAGAELPGSFAADVLREIRLRRAAGGVGRSWWGDFLEFTRRPVVLAAGVGFAAVVGVFTPVVAGIGGGAGPRSEFAIFSSVAPTLPSGLLAAGR